MQLLSSIADLKDIVNKEYIDSILADYVLKANLGALATKDSLAFSDLTSRPSKLSDFTDDVVVGKYLPLNGGTLTGGLTISSGNVLIGTTTDSGYKLDVNGAINTNNYAFSKYGYRLTSGTSGLCGLFAEEIIGGNINADLWLYTTTKANIYAPSGVNITGAVTMSSTFTAAGGTITKRNDGAALIINTPDTSWAGIRFKSSISSVGATLTYSEEGWGVSDEGWTRHFALIHSGNIGDYALPITGGVIRGAGAELLRIARTDGNPYVTFYADGSFLGRLGFSTTGEPIAIVNTQLVSLIHSGNIGSQFVEGIGVTYKNQTISMGAESKVRLIALTASNSVDLGAPKQYVSGLSVMSDYTGWQLVSGASKWDNGDFYIRKLTDEGKFLDWKTIAFTDSNVASATKLQTARTLWGQSFDGTGNVSGTLKNVSWIELTGTNFGIYQGSALNSALTDNDIAFYSQKVYMNGNVLIGTTTDSGYKLDVNGNIGTSGEVFLNHNKAIRMKGSNGTDYNVLFTSGTDLNIGYDSPVIRFGGSKMLINSSGNVGIGTTSPAYNLDVAGSIRTTSTLTIGTIVLTDENGTLKIAGNAYTTGQLGAGEAGQPTSGGGSGQYWSNEYDMDIGTDVLVSSKEYIGTNTIVGWDLAGSCLNDLYIGYDGYTIWMQGSVDEASDMRLKTVIDAVNLDIRDIAFAPIFNYVFKSRPQGRQMLGSSAQYWQAITPKAVSENDKGNLAMNYGAIALASVVAVAKKVVTHEEEIAELKSKVQSLETRLAKYELN